MIMEMENLIGTLKEKNLKDRNGMVDSGTKVNLHYF